MHVSVIVPTRDSGRTLAACLRSVRRQTHARIEILVADNRSSDSTCAIAERFADKVVMAGSERTAQRNHAAAAATGSAFLFVDSDMVLTPSVVSECVEAIGLGADAVVIPEQSFGEGFWARCKALERSCYVGDSTIEAARFFARPIFERVCGYDECLVAGEDWDLHERVVRSGAVVDRISAVILHDEGALRISELTAKKFHYGKTLGVYTKKHPALARQQLRLIRPAFFRHRGRLAKDPVVASGMILMKASEAAAGAAGMLAGKLQ
jgi:glycosyltransferase involved in cell wall biosynthesis